MKKKPAIELFQSEMFRNNPHINDLCEKVGTVVTTTVRKGGKGGKGGQ